MNTRNSQERWTLLVGTPQLVSPPVCQVERFPFAGSKFLTDCRAFQLTVASVACLSAGAKQTERSPVGVTYFACERTVACH